MDGKFVAINTHGDSCPHELFLSDRGRITSMDLRHLWKTKIFCILLNRENVCYISFEETENSFEALNKISWKKKQHQHYCAIWIEKVD
ncbi:hypothetical protein T03_6159 [Trichinella britovi]|uniref:Uncharacterized protein n=1 Tax=Trichinella britovi TaxID=45882 RepID=A0A0V1DCK1_TRIBR|nr:hypothetical protein T03_6159 [Trichinella britovi]